MPRRGQLAALALTVATTAAAACAEDAEDDRLMAGGETTVLDRTSQAYTYPAPNLSPEDLERHLDGDVAFEATFVSAPATINPGLGPTYVNTSCAACHVRDGRGMPVRGQHLVRVSLPDDAGEPDSPGGSVPVPLLGLQIQDHAIVGATPEAEVDVTWRDLPGEYEGGEPYVLREPVVAFEPALPDGCYTSLRQPPPVFGLGLLEAIPELTVVAAEDPDDADGDGISGRANRVWDVDRQATVLGRFGHKANTPTLAIQAAAAYANDMGVASTRFPDPLGATDVDDETVASATFYTQTLAVPVRATPGPVERRGEEMFREAACNRCHLETVETGPHAIAALANQVIHPYTDLLLHDLGDGLADGRRDYLADGREWRTAPLWGIGVVHTVLPYSGFLHDGRARTLEEAILWHGGEAEPSRESFRTMPPSDRAALIAFLNGL